VAALVRWLAARQLRTGGIAMRRIEVTRPHLPPLEEFIPYLTEIWESQRLSNCGPFHLQLEAALAEYLGVEHIALLSNGTMALVVAFEALQLGGEVITTPYSFVATTHALRWKRITPVFADIDPATLNIDPAKVEAAITPRTSAILAVHAYGQPSNVAALQAIADAHGIKLIYDAAHSFGVRDAGGSTLRYGDLSILSFHATKVFTTFEGGAIVCRDAAMKKRIDRLKNFGLSGDDPVLEAGVNGKMNELQAAFGLLQLKHVDSAIRARQAVDSRYRELLDGVSGISVVALLAGVVQNYSYFPILVEARYRETRDQLYARLAEHQVFARRYFYPLISNMPVYSDIASGSKDNLPLANLCAEQVLCLPISPDLTRDEVDLIASLIRG
jgi:dTDP-4-amino-4,6-dideoxygalactose transaminase